VNKGRYIWLRIGFRSGDEPPEDDEDGSPSEPSSRHGSPGVFRVDKPGYPGNRGSGEPSEAENQNSPKQGPRVEKDSDSGFTGFTEEWTQQLADFLNGPPGWFQAQARKHLENPTERTLNPLCVAAATHLYTDANRWQEVKPAVTDWLGKVSA
jgi:hypothetical protein